MDILGVIILVQVEMAGGQSLRQKRNADQLDGDALADVVQDSRLGIFTKRQKIVIKLVYFGGLKAKTVQILGVGHKT